VAEYLFMGMMGVTERIYGVVAERVHAEGNVREDLDLL